MVGGRTRQGAGECRQGQRQGRRGQQSERQGEQGQQGEALPCQGQRQGEQGQRQGQRGKALPCQGRQGQQGEAPPSGRLRLKGVEKAYLYDGTLEGLLSAVFAAYENREMPDEVVREREYAPRLGQDALLVEADVARAGRVRRGIEAAAGTATFTAIVRASVCDDYDVGTAIMRFVSYVMARPKVDHAVPVLDERANPVVDALAGYARRAVNECEKMRQFMRFTHLENGVWFARCNPSCAVVPLIMGHFSARLNDQPFIIYDEAHQVAGVYDGRTWELTSGEVLGVLPASAHDEEMQEAWKRFYDALSVDARYNPELRRHFMPMRLWGNLTELKPRA